MAQASPGALSPTGEASSAQPRSKLSKHALGSVERASPSAPTPSPTTESGSLSQLRAARASASEVASSADAAANRRLDELTTNPLLKMSLPMDVTAPTADQTSHTIPATSTQIPSPAAPSVEPPAILTQPTTNSGESQTPLTPSQTSVSATRDSKVQSPVSSVSTTDAAGMTDSADSILSKLTVSPQTIPESIPVDHSLEEPLLSPDGTETSPPSRRSSTRSSRTAAARRMPSSRRNTRRQNSGTNTSVSPAQVFLSSWGNRDATVEPAPEPQPDDKGQAFGLQNEYIIGEEINHGGFGVVKEAHTMDKHGNSQLYAVKIVRKSIPGKDETENERAQQELEHEVSVWRDLHHPHILKLHAVYDSPFATFCVMDRNVGGTLYDCVSRSRKSANENQGRKGLPPKLAKSYAYQLACALRYLHEDIRVCHRDVKLENCLIDTTPPHAESEGGNLRLCDFGLADFLQNDQPVDDFSPERFGVRRSSSSAGGPGSSGSLSPPHTDPVPTTSSIIGTLEYASPRGLSVDRKLYETAGDVWAFGVIVYALCTGDLPFRHPMPSRTVELIMRAEWDDGALRHAAAGGEEVIDLVKGCLERDIDLRFTIGEALRSPWFEDCRDEQQEESRRAQWR